LGYQDADAADLVQDVFVILWQKLPEFSYDADQSFHAWLKTVFLNRYRSRLRQRHPLTNGTRFENKSAPMLGCTFDEDDLRFLIRRAFRVIEGEFSPLYRDVFRQYVIENCDASAVASRFDVSLGTVYVIKSKVLNRLRDTMKDFND
jgi:RNA polymerase sigma-70 factor, ECF subfamily